MIDICTIDDPRDWSYPFEQELYDDPFVLYHGTISSYAPRIEREVSSQVLFRSPSI